MPPTRCTRATVWPAEVPSGMQAIFRQKGLLSQDGRVRLQQASGLVAQERRRRHERPAAHAHRRTAPRTGPCTAVPRRTGCRRRAPRPRGGPPPCAQAQGSRAPWNVAEAARFKLPPRCIHLLCPSPSLWGKDKEGQSRPCHHPPAQPIRQPSPNLTTVLVCKGQPPEHAAAAAATLVRVCGPGLDVCASLLAHLAHAGARRPWTGFVHVFFNANRSLSGEKPPRAKILWVLSCRQAA
jgi:hypothetical protein